MICSGARIFLFSVLTAWACFGCGTRQAYDFSRFPTFSGEYVNTVIEIPAGTNRIIKWNPEERKFIPGPENGSSGSVDFLPYPANFGFAAGTFTDPVLGGDGQPVGMMIICESLPTGTVIEAVPLLVLYFDDELAPQDRLTDPVIVAVPARISKRVIKAGTYEELFDYYPDAVEIIVKWFGSYRGTSTRKLRAMGDGEVALNEIRKWEVRRY